MRILYFVIFGVISATIVSQPISPAEYQVIIGQGFTTAWFKNEIPALKYNDKNVEDIYSKGFRNVRVRSRADLYSAPYDDDRFAWFLGNLTVVVDKCLEVGVAPIVSWIHHDAEAYATEEDLKNYVTWWTSVAKHLKDKDYRLSFNLFTELGVDVCGKLGESNCNESLRRRPDKYNRWTSDVVAAIRAAGGKSEKRILLLGSPGKTGEYLEKINTSIYQNDTFMMAEWHLYGSGPNKREGGIKYWSGNGIPEGRENVRKAIKHATDFTKANNLLTYLAEWMPQDNQRGSLNETEVISFARFFASEMKKEKIPWSLNVLDRYYDTKRSQWLTEPEVIQGQSLNMSKVLKNIQEVM